jgi:hypothetical protein
MTRRSRTAAVVAVLAIAAWCAVALRRAQDAAPVEPAADSQPAPVAAGSGAAHPRPAAPRSPFAVLGVGGDVAISGHVIDIRQQRPVGDVEVVFRDDLGESSATTTGDGAYAIRLPPGVYRAFVRGDGVISIGRPDRTRLPAPPTADTAGAPDEALMSTVVARGDADGVDLSVVGAGTVSGHVTDLTGRPIAGAVVRAHGTGARPTLGTDIAESADDGSFELRLPAGAFELEATHPRFAGVASAADAQIAIQPGDHLTPTLTLTAGCILSGRVIGPSGKPTGDGAIERNNGQGPLDFVPAGRIEPDGAFRWVTTATLDVTLRAWPWKSPPSAARQFACRDGARFDDVIFQVPDRRPDLEGVLVDQAGAPVAFTYVDLAPLDPGGIAQQERTDAAGRWEVFEAPSGRYRVTAQADGRGVASAVVVSPRDGIRLELGGTGRLEGTTTRLATGSFELALGTCLEAIGQIPVNQTRRLITVTGGRFAIDDLPACQLSFNAIWHGRPLSQTAAIPSGGTARIDLDLGPPLTKLVHGIVRDADGQPIAAAVVTATRAGNADASARTDATGGYSLKTTSGANLRASARGRVGYAQVGGANVDREQVDLVVDEDPAEH